MSFMFLHPTDGTDQSSLGAAWVNADHIHHLTRVQTSILAVSIFKMRHFDLTIRFHLNIIYYEQRYLDQYKRWNYISKNIILFGSRNLYQNLSRFESETLSLIRLLIRCREARFGRQLRSLVHSWLKYREIQGQEWHIYQLLSAWAWYYHYNGHPILLIYQYK